MRPSLERTFRVRHYECDAYENVYYTNYLRYIQETAMDASADVGFDPAWYAANKTSWLVRETEIEYHRPLCYGDSVRVKTWVEDFRHAMSRRAYELREDASGDMVARAATEWVYLDNAKGKPARIPEAFKEKFFPDGPPPEPAKRGRFPEYAPPERSVYPQKRRVEWRDIDPAQHVNNSVYLAYAEDSAVEASMAAGWTPARMREEGFTIRVRRHRIEYKLPAVLGDDLEVATWLRDVGECSATRHYTMTRLSDGVPLARALADLEWADAQTGEAIPIPASYRSAIAP